MDGGAPGPVVPTWRSLPGRALEALADARCCERGPDGPSLDGALVATLARGVETLAAALGCVTPPATGGDRDRVRASLAAAAELTAALAEAARQLAWTAGFSGQEQAAEVADAVMTTAWALRVLAELGLRAVPAPDAGEPSPPRDAP
ncbi:hypothetical protein [Actinomycetospora termitidis]|uniref:Uncharacterized protein n=1 Tax=Actinomycetospora termitidis TaxID=3053470 RepID=A0ABT7M5L3_9PSEU|nr:hypothetical protein [Actinomycetospora sp. Odt1-22]MDL5155741.1 hypothetical protein [Actinomycetospora sp. Odt1-22]